ncbi:SDR family oxidoreductase [Pseudomonas sp. dw_358]|uniref:SDR family oxidoreductase n=1 Tax=Pseudomonas sp. dw_358 TaxID=2720083 RepID=UPI001BD425F7|nr:SDR family oxidoreductase [Pseudomonas sp. dw_358]
MRVFVTGATGFVGSRVVAQLLGAGHQVLGLTRSQAGAQALEAAGAEVLYGNLEDLPSLQQGAEACDAVIHTAFDHDFSHFAENCQKDARAILAMGSVLEGSERPLLITSGAAAGVVAPGQPSIEDHFDPHHANPRVASELAGEALSRRGVNVVVMRLSQIHDTVKQGLVSYAVAHAQRTGRSAYVGEGLNRWSAAHVTDTALLYRLALEKGRPGARYHAVAEEGVSFKRIAEAVALRLGLPLVSLPEKEAAVHFGWLSGFVAMDLVATSTKTRAELGWTPNGPGLLEDLQGV